MPSTDDTPTLRIAQMQEEAATRNLLIRALLTEHYARGHLAIGRIGAASAALSAASVLITPLLLLPAAAFAVAVLVLLVRLRRGDAAIRTIYGGTTVPVRRPRSGWPSSTVVADAVAWRARAERDHDAALARLLDAEAGRS